MDFDAKKLDKKMKELKKIRMKYPWEKEDTEFILDENIDNVNYFEVFIIDHTSKFR